MQRHNCLRLQENGDILYTPKKKGSNPEHEKKPMLKCPICKKNLHTVI